MQLKYDAFEIKKCNQYDHLICSSICTLNKVQFRTASRHALFALYLYRRINSINHLIKNAECKKKIAKCCSEYFFFFISQETCIKRSQCKTSIIITIGIHRRIFTDSCHKFNHYNHHIWEVQNQHNKKQGLARKPKQNRKDGRQEKQKFQYLSRL